jgi:hypothetical protein
MRLWKLENNSLTRTQREKEAGKMENRQDYSRFSWVQEILKNPVNPVYFPRIWRSEK